MRLNNYISATGMCSRREADTLIESGRVEINGITAVLGTQVNPGDTVRVDGKILEEKKSFITLAYHKPAGITCTTEPDVKGNIIDAIAYPERIFPIGRLDKDSEGLILLTNDGSLVNRILRAENRHDKEYQVTLDKPYTQDFLKQMESGVKIYNPVKDEMTVTLPCTLQAIDAKRFSIILNQGLNRQIRRMCSALGYKVVGLKRVRIMHIQLGNLSKGRWRTLSHKEMKDLMDLLEN